MPDFQEGLTKLAAAKPVFTVSSCAAMTAGNFKTCA
jgi:hypothetical protein